ncbi:putative diaminopropionate ammonia-lyase [Aspergillus udagawae]|uniref:Putative diaminopropionate ammonia-lyase n=1 Tax=Aspergillus udagawae TaxID=91492 RepID=A0A8H3NSU2_9EURO|nr:putative diaminopropionate ammonia-lyase [Aspergillus udagawae]
MSRRPIYLNPSAADERCDFSNFQGLKHFHHSLPDYCPTPLVSLPEIAADVGVKAVFVKDESNRFGLPSFKVLGASWGCYRAVVSHLGLPPTVALEAVKQRLKESPVALFAATEGNHGRAVAFMAKQLGVTARIFVPASMDAGTRNRIASEGAEVVISNGDYDQAVKEAWAASRNDGGLLVQDTAFDGYEEVPAWIVEGYSTMMTEIDEQLSQLGLQSTLTVTPVGVGSLAHAVVRHCKSRTTPIAVVAVEPDSGPCLISSLHAGKMVTVKTSETIMNGMNCGTVSATAWPDLQRVVDAVVTVSSYESHCAVEYLTSHNVRAGPCGGASLAAIRQLNASDQAASLLRRDTVVVLLCTEGARPYSVPRDVAVEDVVGLTQALTQIDSSNPTLSVADGVGETEIAHYLAAWFAHRGIEYHRVEPVAGRPSIVGVLRGSGGGQSLMFNGHIDTVSLTSYEHDPLSGQLGERQGKPVIFGRGSLDMKGGLAAALAALAAIKASGRTLRGDVIVAAVSDEEDASQGTRDIIAAGWRADAAVVPEPTMGAIAVAHKGFVWVEVDILGVAAHGSDPQAGQDAILHAGWFLQSLEQYQTRLPIDDTLGQASLHCGLVKGGQEPSSYPERCTITIEFRTIPAQSNKSILGDMNALLSDIAKEKPRFRYAPPRLTVSRPTQKLSADHPLVQKTIACAAEVLGARPEVVSVPFWCDAALLSEVGVPAIVYGPSGAGLHSKEEWVEVDSLQRMSRVFEKLIQEFCD